MKKIKNNLQQSIAFLIIIDLFITGTFVYFHYAHGLAWSTVFLPGAIFLLLGIIPFRNTIKLYKAVTATSSEEANEPEAKEFDLAAAETLVAEANPEGKDRRGSMQLLGVVQKYLQYNSIDYSIEGLTRIHEEIHQYLHGNTVPGSKMPQFVLNLQKCLKEADPHTSIRQNVRQALEQTDFTG